MNDEELTRLAEEEILRETKRAAERAAVYGALGWMKCPLRPTNKQFLVNTILPTLSTNKNRHHEARRNYYRSDDETHSRGFSPDDRYHSSDRHSHRARRDSDSEGRSSHSHRDGKSSRERRDKHKDSSPRKRKHSDSGNFDTNKKESENSCSTENKTADFKNNVDEHKESVHTHHKSSKDKYNGGASHKSHKVDKHAHIKSESSHHNKKHDDPVSADQQYKDNEQKDQKTEVEERHTKGRFDVTNENEHIVDHKTEVEVRQTNGRFDVTDKIEHSVDHKTEVEERHTKGRFDVTDKIEHSVDHKTEVEEKHTKGRLDMTDKIEHSLGMGLENCKAEKRVENSIACDSSSESKYCDVAVKQEETKDVQSNDTEHEKPYVKKDSAVAKKVNIVSENNSNYKKGKHKKKISGKIGDKEDLKKRKKSRKRKKDKSKKDEGMHRSESKKVKKKRRALTADSESIEALLHEGSMGSIAKVRKTENKSESIIRYDKRNDEEKKWNSEDKLKMQQQYGNTDSGRLSREENARLEDLKYRCKKSEAKQDVNNDFRTKENDICRNFNAKAEKFSKKIVKSSATEEDNNNCSKDNTNSVCQLKKKSVKNKQTLLSESKDSSYVTSDKLKEATACDKNSTCSKTDNGKNYSSEKYKSKESHHKHSRSLKDTTNSPVHHRGKSDCLRDITDELYQDTKNTGSKKSKRKRWSIESD